MNRRGFSLIELLTLVLVLGTLVALLVVGSQRTRRSAQLNESLNNLKAITTLTASYQADNADRYWSFSWPGGVLPDSTFADLRSQALGGNDLEAASAQAVDILRRRAPGGALFPVQTGWLPHILYSHLVLADYGDVSLPLQPFVSPAHASLVALSRDPFAGGLVRQGFQSSYEPGPAFYSPDRADNLNPGISQGSTHNQYTLNGQVSGILRGRPLAEVAFPSQKVHLYESAQRHFSVNPIYFAFAQARPLMLAADGHAAVRQTAKCNPGFRPTSPRSPSPTTYSYQPSATDPPTPGGGTPSLIGYLRWTRGGLQGRDFDGREIDTSTW